MRDFVTSSRRWKITIHSCCWPWIPDRHLRCQWEWIGKFVRAIFVSLLIKRFKIDDCKYHHCKTILLETFWRNIVLCVNQLVGFFWFRCYVFLLYYFTYKTILPWLSTVENLFCCELIDLCPKCNPTTLTVFILRVSLLRCNYTSNKIHVEL